MGRNLWLAVFVGFVFLVSACGGRSGKVIQKGEISREIDQKMVEGDYVQSMGIGAADQSIDNKTQRMATSRNAAIVMAQYEMLSFIKGLKLEGGITVEKAIETDSVIATKIDAEIKGSEITKTSWTNDDGCIVNMRLPKKRLKAMGLKLVE
ncbi:MAG: hypothetical protein KJ967_01315 [Elusimicrobia bacterium]|nr:hypothetical protein [Elusimicrobiota bacterium]